MIVKIVLKLLIVATMAHIYKNIIVWAIMTIGKTLNSRKRTRKVRN